MKSSNASVLEGLERIRKEYESIVEENGYCTTETEKFEHALTRLIRSVAQDKDTE